jgi:hypothetical protein
MDRTPRRKRKPMEAPQAHEGRRPVETAAWGPGWLAPASEAGDQSRDLILFDRKNPPHDDRGRPVFGCTVDEETPVCASKKGGKDGFCAREQREQNGRCKNHGGRSPKGAASPHYSGKGRSRYEIAGHLLKRYERYLSDPELHHHRTSIAAIDSIISELWESYQGGMDPDAAVKIAKKYRQLRIANASGNRMRSLELFEELGQLVEAAETSTNQAERIVRFLEARRRHADSESRRKLAESMVFTLEEAYRYYTALGNAVNTHVKDRVVRRALLDEVAAIAGQNPSAASGAASAQSPTGSSP